MSFASATSSTTRRRRRSRSCSTQAACTILPRGNVGAYRTRLNEWLAPGGDSVLVHFAHRPRMLWIPKGPRHMTRNEAVALFAPLKLQAYDEARFDVPLPMGRMGAGSTTGSLVVRRTNAIVREAEDRPRRARAFNLVG